MCGEKNNCRDNNCLAKVLEKIILLQRIENNQETGCNKPFLGNLMTVANTRPINLYSCCTNKLWEMPYNYNSQTGTSSFFRIENVNENCATFRILIRNDSVYTATNNFFIINLNCISTIKCLADTLISNL